MKYIMFEDFSGDPVPILFPNRIDFEEMRAQIPYAKLLSAGYVQLQDGRFVCHGESRFLGAQSRAEDAAILDAKFNPDE